jgi:hypothetical protein
MAITNVSQLLPCLPFLRPSELTPEVQPPCPHECPHRASSRISSILRWWEMQKHIERANLIDDVLATIGCKWEPGSRLETSLMSCQPDKNTGSVMHVGKRESRLSSHCCRFGTLCSRINGVCDEIAVNGIAVCPRERARR